MDLRKMMFLCLLTGAFCACNQGRETNTTLTPVEVTITPFPTPEATATGLPENTKAPSGTAEPAGELAIDEIHFGDKAFCEYLKKNYDSDKNGYFSEKEIQSVKNLSLKSYRQMTTPYTELKGFSYFTALEFLELNSADSVIVSRVPKLRWISVETYRNNQTVEFGGVIIEDCPELGHISIHNTAFQSKGETEERIFSIKDCVNLEQLYIIDSDFGNARGTITGTPELIIKIFDSVPPEKLIVDADTYFSLSDIVVCNVTEREVLLPKAFELRWSEEDTRFPLEKGLAELERLLDIAAESFFIRVEEVTPALYDEYGNRAYYAMIDSSRIVKDRYYFSSTFETREKYATYDNSILLYSAKKPPEGAFSIRWNDEIEARYGTYSAVRGMEGRFHLEGEVTYLADGAEMVLGNVCIDGGYEINREGALRIYDGAEDTVEFGDYTSSAVWLKEKSPVTPAPEENAVLIDRTHFSNLFFREYLEDVVDLDRDGYLSLEERKDIIELDLVFMDTGADYLDGFEWFPNLQRIYCNACRKLVKKNG